MKRVELIEAMGGKGFMIALSFLFVGAGVIMWCLTSAIVSPFEHLSCPLFSML